MKTALTPEIIERIKENYPLRWFNAITSSEAEARVNQFYGRHPGTDFSYETVFFSIGGIGLLQHNETGEQRYFSLPSELFPTTSPLSNEDAQGDWMSWVKNATIIKEMK